MPTVGLFCMQIDNWNLVDLIYFLFLFFFCYFSFIIQGYIRLFPCQYKICSKHIPPMFLMCLRLFSDS